MPADCSKKVHVIVSLIADLVTILAPMLALLSLTFYIISGPSLYGSIMLIGLYSLIHIS